MNIKTIFWDLGNVIFKIRSNDFLDAVFKESNIKKTNKIEKTINQLITLSFKGKISLDETISQFASTIQCDKQILYKLLEPDWIIANHELIEYVLSIPVQYRQGIISDLWHIPYYWIRKRYQNFLQKFDKELLIFSNMTGLSKRDDGQRYLIHILKSLKLQPDSVCIIDDDAKIIKTANMIGIQTILYPKVYLRQETVNWQEANQLTIKRIKQILI